jgi:hypothetical protein
MLPCRNCFLPTRAEKLVSNSSSKLVGLQAFLDGAKRKSNEAKGVLTCLADGAEYSLK